MDLTDLDTPVVPNLSEDLDDESGYETWSPDGAYLAFVNFEVGARTYVVRTGDPTPGPIADELLLDGPVAWRPRVP